MRRGRLILQLDRLQGFRAHRRRVSGERGAVQDPRANFGQAGVQVLRQRGDFESSRLLEKGAEVGVQHFRPQRLELGG